MSKSKKPVRKNRQPKNQKQLATVFSPPKPDRDDFDIRDEDDDEKHAVAEWLTEMTGHRIKLEYMPTAFFDNETTDNPPSRGHIFEAKPECRDEGEGEDFGESFHVTIDDRIGDVRQQFVNELRRIAGVFEGIAKLVEREADPIDARYTKLGSYPTLDADGKIAAKSEAA